MTLACSHALSTSRGAHDTLSLFFLERVRLLPEDLALFNIKHVVADHRNRELPVFLEPAGSAAGYKIFEHRSASGYFEVIRIPVQLRIPSLDQSRPVAAALSTALYPSRALPDLGWGAPLRTETWVTAADAKRLALVREGEILQETVFPEALAEQVARPYSGIPRSSSRVLEESASSNRYRALVRVDAKDEFVLLTSSYHPYWEAMVNGVRGDVRAVGPNLMAVAAPPGTHEVFFRYRNPWGQKAGCLASVGAGLVSVVYLWVKSRRARKHLTCEGIP